MNNLLKSNSAGFAMGKKSGSSTRTRDKLSFSFQISSSVDQITRSIKMFDEFLENRNCCCSRTKNELSTALSEALANAIIHGNKTDIEKCVKIKINIKKDRMIVSVKDMGAGFDYQNLPDPLAPENIKKTSGRGVYLMSMLVDQVKFIRHKDGFEVRLIKFFTLKNHNSNFH